MSATPAVPTSSPRASRPTGQRGAPAPAAGAPQGALDPQGQEAYDRFDKYLNGCVKLFRDGYNTVHQYTLQK